MIKSLKERNIMRKILIFGDSVAAGRGIIKNKSWSSRLAQYFDVKDKWETIVHNLSIPGGSSSELLKRFKVECNSRVQPNLPQDKIIIFIAVGINDSKGLNSPEKLKTPLGDFRKNILKIIDLAKMCTDSLIFVGLTPVDEKKTSPVGNNYFLNKSIKKYNDMIKDICKKKKLIFIDVFDNWVNKDFRKFLTEDGIHLNKLGHQKIFEKIKPFINLYANK